MYSYFIVHKLLNSTVDNLTPTPTCPVKSSNEKPDRKSVKSMYFYICLYFVSETDQLMKYFPKMYFHTQNVFLIAVKSMFIFHRV